MYSGIADAVYHQVLRLALTVLHLTLLRPRAADVAGVPMVVTVDLPLRLDLHTRRRQPLRLDLHALRQLQARPLQPERRRRRGVVHRCTAIRILARILAGFLLIGSLAVLDCQVFNGMTSHCNGTFLMGLHRQTPLIRIIVRDASIFFSAKISDFVQLVMR